MQQGLHNQFNVATTKLGGENNRDWLKKTGSLKKETENTIFVA